VTSYRRMRRQARQIRRSGMQPMMFVSGDPSQFPAPAGVMLARFAWRYRSELAPLGVAVVTLLAGCWTHAALAKWWAVILAGSSVAAWLIAFLGARFGLAPIVERVYAATATFLVGGWLAVATVLGPFTSPLPRILGIGTMVLAVPWWAHRRRRAKVRVERKLAACRTSRGQSASSAPRSCPPPSMCGDGARGSASHGARPSPM